MSDYDNTNRGVLFKNDKKTTEKHPDYQGNINVNGTEYKLAAWIKTSKKGDKFMSISVSSMAENASKQKHDKAKADGYAPERKAFVDDNLDDCPF